MGPIGNHWFKFAYVNLGFITIIAIMVYYISMKEIHGKKDQVIRI